MSMLSSEICVAFVLFAYFIYFCDAKVQNKNTPRLSESESIGLFAFRIVSDGSLVARPMRPFETLGEVKVSTNFNLMAKKRISI